MLKQMNNVLWLTLLVVVVIVAVMFFRGTAERDAVAGPPFPELIVGEEVPYEVLEVLAEGYRARNAATGEETTLFIPPDAPAVFGPGIDSLEDIATGHVVGVVAYRIAANGIVAEGVAIFSPTSDLQGVSEPPSATPPRQ